MRDPLTGLAAPRLFYEMLYEELARHSRYKTVFSLALLDVDGLGEINEAVGSEVGDLVLRRVAQELKRHARNADLSRRGVGVLKIEIRPNRPARVDGDSQQPALTTCAHAGHMAYDRGLPAPHHLDGASPPLGYQEAPPRQSRQPDRQS